MHRIEEELVAWDEGHAFTYVFDEPPWPMKSILNEWRIETEDDGTRLTLTPAVTIRGRGFQWLAPLVLWAMSRALRGNLPAMQQRIEVLADAPLERERATT